MYASSYVYLIVSWEITHTTARREKCPNRKFFLVHIFPHLDWIRTRKNSVFGHFSGSDGLNGKHDEWEFTGLNIVWVITILDGLSWIGINWLGISWLVIILGGNFPGGNSPGGSFPGGNYWVGIIRVTIFRVGVFVVLYKQTKIKNSIWVYRSKLKWKKQFRFEESIFTKNSQHGQLICIANQLTSFYMIQF